jgi:hypothetical protein
MTITTVFRCAFLTVSLAGLSFGQPQSMIIPQIADGGAWQTTLVLTNTTTGQGSASFNFYQETAGGATQSWNLPFVEGAMQSVQVGGGATVFLHTLGTASATSVGWGQIIVTPGIVAYAIFTQRVPGRSDQDGTAPGGNSTERFLVPFDNTSGCVTAVAIANPTSGNETISVNLELETGATSQASITLPAQGHQAITLPDQFPGTGGHRGLAEFYMPVRTGAFTMIALRFNATGAFTTAPVYGQSGAPIVGVKPPPPSGK